MTSEQLAEIAHQTRREESRIAVLRLIFIGIAFLMGYLGVLVLINWYIPNSVDSDGVGMAFFQTSKDILLVMTGILGSAMSSVFETRSSRTQFAPASASAVAPVEAPVEAPADPT
jgi:hypothetical protein